MGWPITFIIRPLICSPAGILIGAPVGFKPSLQAISVVHSHTSNGVLTDMLLNLNDQSAFVWPGDGQCLMNLRQHLFSILAVGIEIDIDNRPDYLRDAPYNLCHNRLLF